MNTQIHKWLGSHFGTFMQVVGFTSLLQSFATIHAGGWIYISYSILHKSKYTNTNRQTQIHKYKYTNTNALIQIQIHRYKNTNTQIHKYIYTYTNIQMQNDKNYFLPFDIEQYLTSSSNLWMYHLFEFVVPICVVGSNLWPCIILSAMQRMSEPSPVNLCVL